MKTSQDDESELLSLIYSNIIDLHPGESIPKLPWFARSHSKHTEQLLKILESSYNNHAAFANKVFKLVLKLKEENEDIAINKASLLKESLDIAEALKKASMSTTIDNILNIKINKSQSIFGPMTVFVLYQNLVYSVDEGEEVCFPVVLNEDVLLNFIVFGNEEKLKVSPKSINIANTIENFHYFHAMDSGIIEDQRTFKTCEFEVSMDIRLHVSKSERVKKFIDKGAECESLIKEINMKTNDYEELLSILKISENEDGTYRSTIEDSKSNLRCCDDSCVIY